MEYWRTEAEESRRPKVLSGATLSVVTGVHIAFFVGLYLFAVVRGLLDKPPEVIPIDLTVVVQENLDGNPDEPPPLKKPEPPPPPPPPPPKPKPQPKPKPKEPEPPKELDKIVTNVVKKVEKKEEKPKPEAKPEKPKEPEKPKKTAKELREERIKRMRESARDTKQKPQANAKPTPPQPNGRTDRKTLSDAEIQKLLNQGYRPGASTNLAASEEQLCYSLIRQAFEEKWDKPPWTDTLRPMTLRIWFGGGGRIARFTLVNSSGDPKADATIKAAANRVGIVRGLTPGFIEKYGSNGVLVRFTVEPR